MASAVSPRATCATSPARQQALDHHKEAAVLIFDGLSSHVVDLDFRGTVDECWHDCRRPIKLRRKKSHLGSNPADQP